jgi:hypothetical protein
MRKAAVLAAIGSVSAVQVTIGLANRSSLVTAHTDNYTVPFHHSRSNAGAEDGDARVPHGPIGRPTTTAAAAKAPLLLETLLCWLL